MDQSKLTELESIFASFESEVRKHAVKIGRNSLLFSNLVSVPLQATQAGMFKYLLDAVKLIEKSETYTWLESEVETYYRECCGQQDPYSGLSFPECVHDEFTKEEWDELFESTNSALSLWLISSGFYRLLLLEGDRESWVGRFSDFLREMPDAVGKCDCFLAVDEFRSEQFSLGESELISADESRCQVLKRLVDFELVHGHAGVDHHESKVDKFVMRSFYYLYKQVSRREVFPPYQTICARNLVNTVFKDESIALMLSSPYSVSFPNAFVLPVTGADTLDSDIHISQIEAHWHFLWGWASVGTEIPDYLKQITLKRDETIITARLANELVRLLSKWRTKIGTCVDLFKTAGETKSQTVAFLLYVVALESLLLGRGTSELKVKFCLRFSKLLSPNSRKQQELLSIADLLYRARSDLVHGNDPELLDDFSRLQKRTSVSLEQLRNWVRLCIIIALFSLDTLHDDSSELRKQISAGGHRVPRNFKELVELLHKSFFDESLWAGFYNDVYSAYSRTRGGEESPFCV